MIKRKRIDWMRLIASNKTWLFEVKKEGRFTRYYISGTNEYISPEMFKRLVIDWKQPAVVKESFI